MLALVKEYFWIFFISMVPIVELRGAVPAGLAMGLPVIPTYIVSVIGNMLPVPVILLFAKAVLLAATLLDLKFWPSVLAVLCGVMTAGLIMGAASAGLLGALGMIFA